MAEKQTTGAAISFAALGKSFEKKGSGQVMALEDVSLDVPAGTRALFPHFRSDGWFYFLVMDGERELIIASDAALVIAGG